jgi:branched-chain amino acid aminotransferase
MNNKAAVYETFRSFKGVFALLPEHQLRLNKSCHTIGVEAPDLQRIASEFKGDEVRLRVNVLPDRFEVFAEKLPRWNSFLYDPWKVKFVNLERENPELKGMKSEEFVRVADEAKDEGYDEIILVNSEGLITEGGITNVYFISGEKIVTPKKNILHGIARELIFEAAKNLQIVIEERAVHADEKFDAMFLSNSIRGIIPVEKVHPIMKELADWCTDFINKRIDERN